MNAEKRSLGYTSVPRGGECYWTREPALEHDRDNILRLIKKKDISYLTKFVGV
jgi:hypothetical protein